MELGLRRPGPRGRAVHQLPAQEDRRGPGAADPHRPRRRLRAEARQLRRAMSTAAGARASPARRLRRWLAGPTLRGRLITGLVALLFVACAAVGVVTYAALRGFLL